MKAIWNGKIIAESDDIIEVEKNYYFPPENIKKEFFKSSETTSQCFWKGEAHYYDVVVDGEVNKDAAWYYPSPKQKANNIKSYVAFWKGVKIEK